MFDRLDQIEERYEELGRQLSDPNIVSDQANYRKVSKQHRDLEDTVEKFREYRKLKDGVSEAKAMLGESETASAQAAAATANTKAIPANGWQDPAVAPTSCRTA